MHRAAYVAKEIQFVRLIGCIRRMGPRLCPDWVTIEVITLAAYEYFEPWAGTRWKHRGVEYEGLPARLAERLLEQL